ncbi:Nramp family divalent metal transporter [Methanosphaera stadtmanae]|uniref:Nramp family divalent metal transporter n=1 Tax=Methanosphaera stadtmanae TaxID=2317 RepID=UPI002E79EA70|nr:Nramp family divalent metal transporter [Methanosphaera stadtmanae]MEE0489487.1 Nramp family divalent metal transporter [Methanosphaera stadtmanae]
MTFSDFVKHKLKNYPTLASIFIFISVLGPGLITAMVDNDSGGILTYSLAGAQYGYNLIWTFIPMIFSLIVAQEMGVRMGIISGKGLASLIREKVGVKITIFIMIGLLIANMGNTLAEFSGIVVSSEIFGIPSYISVILAAIIIWLLVIKGNYKNVEKIFIIFSLVYISYIVAGLMAHPDWSLVASSVVPKVQLDTPYITMVVGLIGTTIAPWMQFYLQSSVVEKGVSKDELKYSRAESILGPIFTGVVALFILIACAATIHVVGTPVSDVKDIATALIPVAGEYAGILFGLGFLNASLFSAIILPLSTAYYVCESLGFETGISKSFKEAPMFHGLYAGMIFVCAIIILIPNIPLMQILLFSQVLNGILLPFILVLMLMIINDKRIMGEYVNSKWYNMVAWIITVIITILVIILVITSFM